MEGGLTCIVVMLKASYICIQRSLLFTSLAIMTLFLPVFSQFLLPGLVDTHIHAPQYVNSGVGYDMMLMDWLDAYTFPAEAEFQKIEVCLSKSCGEPTAQHDN